MSRENVALFVKAINTRTDLNAKVSRTTKASDWVALGDAAGFAFTVDELVGVVASMLNRPLTENNVISEYFAASHAAIKGELSQKALVAVMGGMKPAFVKCNPLFVRG
jgi:hypothetical protein